MGVLGRSGGVADWVGMGRGPWELGIYPFDFFVFLLSFNFFSVYFIFQIVLVL